MNAMRRTRIRTAKASGARLVKNCTLSAGSRFFIEIAALQSAFHPHEQRTAFYRRDVRLQSILSPSLVTAETQPQFQPFSHLTPGSRYVQLNSMRAARLQDALERLPAAIRDLESELASMKAEHDPLASHIFISRRHYRNVNDTKSGRRRETMARLSFNTACELGFRGSLDEWERLMGAVARR